MPKRIPPEVLEYLRKIGKAYGSQGGEEHDGCGTIGPREEGIGRRGPETHGCTAGTGTGRTREEIAQELRTAGPRELSGGVGPRARGHPCGERALVIFLRV